MIASLPMYWRAETADLWRDFWRVLQSTARAEGCALPDLTAPEDLPVDWVQHWSAPDLALSMTCALPLRTALRDRVTYVGTLGFGLPGPAGHYYSRVLINRPLWEARRGKQPIDTPGLCLAYNGADSQSGWAVSQLASPFKRPLRFTRYLRTGSHWASVRAVAEGRADIAFVDAVTWRLIKRYDTGLDGAQLLGRTGSSPGLPLITARGTDPEPLRRALRAAVVEFRPEDHWAMGGPLSFEVLDLAAYLDQPVPTPPPAAGQGM